MLLKHLFISLILLPAIAGTAGTVGAAPNACGNPLEIRDAAVLVPAGNPPRPVLTAATVLAEEVAKRTGLAWAVVTERPATGMVIELALQPAGSKPPLPAEEFEIALNDSGLRITGADPRGVLYGAGWLLRQAEWSPGAFQWKSPAATRSWPAEAIRGHQLGYRSRANSYDAWDAAQYEQYIRELAIFGANCIENIPFEDTQPSPHMKLSRRDMNRRMSEICQEYGLEYWVWTPAVFDLKDAAQRAEHLAEHEQLYQDCPELTGVFFPGGDPGDNHPREVMPFLADLAPVLAKYHPEAGIWVSLQGFDPEQVDYFYAWLGEHQPAWLEGVVSGPGSPAIGETRQRLPRQYRLRHYPDITHTVRCQYPVKWWDPAFAVTLGRECINPRPVHEKLVHNIFAPYLDGSLSYSDGIHDDVNKAVWSQCGWDPQRPVRDVLTEYARFFFRPDLAETAAHGILALERNWEGPLAENGGVAASLALWTDLESRAPGLADNWRWQMCLVRANYDAYTAARLRYEPSLEDRANAELAPGVHNSPEEAMDAAMSWLRRAETEPCRPDLHARVVALFDDLFRSIGLQSSVEKYQASGHERGCSLDFLDYPLNNRWWLEDEFKKVRELPDAAAQWARLETLRTWEHPGPGSFYDNIGYVGRCPHVLRGEGMNTDPLMERDPNPEAWWWDNGFSRARLSWQCTMDVMLGLVYEALDPRAEYLLRFTGYGDAKPRANGEPLSPTVYGKEIGAIKEFPIPPSISASGKLVITFDKLNEDHLNWRQQSRIAEVWLITK
jgi:hypothetical protein